MTTGEFFKRYNQSVFSCFNDLILEDNWFHEIEVRGTETVIVKLWHVIQALESLNDSDALRCCHEVHLVLCGLKRELLNAPQWFENWDKSALRVLNKISDHYEGSNRLQAAGADCL